MKKKGYTLAELLLTVGIVGIVTALVFPMVNRFKPDKDKIAYIRVYNELAEQVKQMNAKSNLFPICIGEYCFEDTPLFNNQSVKFQNEDLGDGNGKICKILAKQFNASSNTCSNNYAPFNGNFSFTTHEGIQFYVSTERSQISDSEGSLMTEVVFDINGTNGVNKLYGEDDCKTPDRFKVYIDAKGNLIAADPIGQEYLVSQWNWKRSKKINELAKGEIKDSINGLTPEQKRVEITKRKTPQEECEDAGNVWQDGVCKTHQEVCEGEGNTWSNGACTEPQKEVDKGIGCGYDQKNNFNGKIVDCINYEYEGTDGRISIRAGFPVTSDICVYGPLYRYDETSLKHDYSDSHLYYSGCLLKKGKYSCDVKTYNPRTGETNNDVRMFSREGSDRIWNYYTRLDNTYTHFDNTCVYVFNWPNGKSVSYTEEEFSKLSRGTIAEYNNGEQNFCTKYLR